MKSLLVVVSVTAVGMAAYRNVGPLSTLVVTLAFVAIAASCYRYLSDWNSYTAGRRAEAIFMSFLGGLVLLAVFAGLWMQTQVQANRLTTVYRLKSGSQDLNVSVFQGKGTLLSVSGTLSSRRALIELRSEILDDFSAYDFLRIRWDVTTGNQTVVGSDRELFPEGYDANQRGIPL